MTPHGMNRALAGGILVGVWIGVGLMCLFQINRKESDE